jgi:hypothetical protein
LNEVKFDEGDSCEVLDERNKKYMEFLKSLELEAQHKNNEKINNN